MPIEPYVGFKKSTTDKLPLVYAGTLIDCPDCFEKHSLESGRGKDGKETDIILFYRCHGKLKLGAVDNRLVAYTKPDVSGADKIF